jgi:hypothetical protein
MCFVGVMAAPDTEDYWDNEDLYRDPGLESEDAEDVRDMP